MQITLPVEKYPLKEEQIHSFEKKVDSSSSITSLLIPYKASDKNAYIVEMSYKSIRFYVEHGIRIKDDEIYSINSPYKYRDLFDENGISKIQYIQNGDYLYLFHPKYPVKVLYRNKDNEWFIEDFEFRNGPFQPVNTTSASIQVKNEEGDYRVTSNIGAFSKGDVGKLIRITMDTITVSSWVSKKEYVKGDIVLSDGKYYECTTAGTSGDIKPTHTFGLRTDGNLMWEYKHAGYAIAKITNFYSETSIGIEPVGEFPSSFVGVNTNYFEFSVFGGDCIYPMSGAFYRGRFAVIADTNNIPTVYMSCSDDYDNFNDKEFGEVLDTNAITIPLYANEYATSSFLISGSILFAGTSSGEFSIDSATTANPLSPSNVQNKQFSSFGSLPIMPVRVGSSILYVSKQGVGLRNILYSFEKDGYESLDLSLFGKHLLHSGIKQIAYQELPDKVVWIVTQDGNLVGLTYMSEQNVSAFHRHDLGGFIQNIAVIPNPFDKTDDLWLEVNRDGLNCIEWQDVGFSYDEKNAFFMDSGLSMTRDFSTTFEGNVKETSGALRNKEVIVYQQNKFRDVYEPKDEDEVEFIIHGEQSHLTEDCGVSWLIANGDKLQYRFEFEEKLVGLKFEVTQFYTEWGTRKAKTILEGYLSSTLLTFDTSITGSDNGLIITFEKEEVKEDVAIGGLGHLEGKEVKVMVNGTEQPNQIVTNGEVFVPYYSKEISVGLPIESVFIPQIMYISGNNGSGIGDVQRIDHVTLMLHKSLGGKVGSGLDNLQDIFFRTSFEKMDKGTPLFSGNKTILINSNTSLIQDKGAVLVVYNDSVFPMNILAIAPHLTSSGNGL